MGKGEMYNWVEVSSCIKTSSRMRVGHGEAYRVSCTSHTTKDTATGILVAQS